MFHFTLVIYVITFLFFTFHFGDVALMFIRLWRLAHFTLYSYANSCYFNIIDKLRSLKSELNFLHGKS